MKELKVEIADSPVKREKGLMGRKNMDKNSGMLFRFPYPNHLSFWMKNTYIPLHIAFVDDSGEIFQIEEMAPLSTKGIRSSRPCRFALEVPHGWFRENNIDVGSKIYGSLFKNVERPSKSVYCNYTMGKLYSIAQTLPPRNPDDEDEDEDDEGQPIPEEAPVPEEQIPNVPPVGEQPQQPGQPQQPEEVNPVINALQSFKDKFALANRYGLDLILVYNQVKTDSEGNETGESVVTEPRSITLVNGQYAFEDSTRGNLLVRVWDEFPRTQYPTYVRSPGEKTFKIKNIVALDFKPEDEEFLRDRKEIQ